MFALWKGEKMYVMPHLSHSVVIGGELVDLYVVGLDLLYDALLEAGQLRLRDGVSLGDDGDHIDLRVELLHAYQVDTL